jgi:hypothetical protein
VKITAMRFYGGAREKVCRLGLANLFFELQQIIFDTRIAVEETVQANGAAEVRAALDATFKAGTDWQNTASGGIDWIKRLRYNATILVRLGVEVQVSARSDLLIRDVVHLRKSLQEGVIDVGVIIVPSDRFSTYLVDRTPSLADAIRYIEHEFPEATLIPVVLIAVEYDGIGPALPKRTTNMGAKTRLKTASVALADAVSEPIRKVEAVADTTPGTEATVVDIVSG